MTKCGTTQFLNIMKELAVSCQGPGQTTGPPSPPPADDPPPDDNPPPGKLPKDDQCSQTHPVHRY